MRDAAAKMSNHRGPATFPVATNVVVSMTTTQDMIAAASKPIGRAIAVATIAPTAAATQVKKPAMARVPTGVLSHPTPPNQFSCTSVMSTTISA